MLKNLPPSVQVVLFIFLVVFMAMLGQIIFQFSVSIPLNEESMKYLDLSDPRMVIARSLFFQIFSFLLAFMLFLYLTKEKFIDIIQIDKLRLKPILITLAVFVLAMLAMVFVFEYITAGLKAVLPTSIVNHEETQQEIQQAFMLNADTTQFVFSIIMMAVLPAICEELVFRGFLIKKLLQSGMSKYGAILFSAAIFSLTHFQPLNFFTIFFFGIILGFIYLRFKNIKYAMLLHFLVNSSQITVAYLIGSGGV